MRVATQSSVSNNDKCYSVAALILGVPGSKKRWLQKLWFHNRNKHCRIQQWTVNTGSEL